ncbi:MAG TPA: hypothetical protein VL832_22485 [Puia sp.]|jgi:hypothetical protein|nr:hypothetical protein [Puia sp.]
MISRATLTDFFSKSKVIFATFAAIITFSITLYNQFKGSRATEISGIVADEKNSAKPVDAVVRISSPIQAQTETDSRGRFKFRLENLPSDTFLLIVQNKRTNTITKQNEFVNASRGRTDIVVLFDAEMRDGGIYNSYDTVHQRRRQTSLKKIVEGLFR